MHYDRYMPVEIHTKKATGDEATADKVEFDLPYEVNGAIAQVIQTADDAVDATGLKVDIDGKKVTVEVDSLAENDIVTILATK